MNRNNTIYWIGGSACAGKSTLAKRFAEENNLTLYACDEHYGKHLQRTLEEAQSAMYRVSRMTMNEVFLTRSIAEQLNTYTECLREDFRYVLEDLAGLRDRPVVAEGNQLLPGLVKPLLRRTDKAVWVIPAEQFQVEQYRKREWIQGILKATEDPELAFGNWMKRDAMFAGRIKQSAEEQQLRVLEVDGSRTLEQNFAELTSWFGC
ncbi:hypothetical protein [Paenibacillus sp. MMS20-IR301]|uniref:hypothetical protein n=1 Tax=Paenibacillus sp. MMS20-IR301 TaxID=2895946 RepID=UPI0028E3C3CF|nr:hypothetical protein [Paenibacillus sp. MMS20-IR301]WNS41421.1 hypothetical protein LOS79_20560 [Paenibacillus sp. MMS20-IR301]